MLCTCLAVTSHYFLMRNEIFDGIGEKLLQTKAVPIALLHLSIICWSLSKNYPVRSSRSKSTTRLQPARGKRVCQDLNQTAQQLHMAARKSLETMIDMILNWSQPKIAAKFVQMKCYGWKRCSDKRWQGKLWFSIWRFFKQSAFVNNHLLCYWPAIDNLISKICPKFQVLSSTFLRLMSCWMSSKVKKVQLKFMSNALIKGLHSRIPVFRAWPLYSTWAIWEVQSCTQKGGCKLQNTSLYLPFLSEDWHNPMVKWSRWMELTWPALVWFPVDAETLCWPLAILRGTEPVSAQTQVLFKLLHSP